MSDIKYWVGLNLVPDIGPRRFALLRQYFGSLEEAWKASAADLRLAGLSSRAAEALLATRASVSLDKELERLSQKGIQVMTLDDPCYPPRLKEIYDPPPVLYVRGKLTPEDEWSVAVVGTRQATTYGQEVARRLARGLAQNRITIVSGLATGIDTVAHRAALEAEGRTIAILGCGLDIVYPASNARLAREIAERGALLSELPLGTMPKPGNFPQRNRIISGLSLGVLIVEAGDKSGALSTARHALDQNREVFAVPGSILAAMSRGTNRLIQDGAKLVSSVQDILEELNLTMVGQQLEMKELIPANETELLIMRHLSAEPSHIDELCRSSGLPVASVSSTLTMMELKGMVRQVGGMNYVLTR